MFYTVYKVTNSVNGKSYTGKHQTDDLNDRYLGSGNNLKRAIKKYGIDKFQKEILFVFDNEKDMNDKEKELVVVSEQSYNLCEGGQGGFGYINQQGLNYKGFASSTERNKKISPFVKGHKFASFGGKASVQLKRGIHNPNFIRFTQGFLGKSHSAETRKQMSESAKGRVTWNKGKNHSEETKNKIRKTLLGG